MLRLGHSFDLVDRPWIGCLMRDGQEAELGLLDVLVRAPDIRRLFDPSPPVMAALHRLLLAILHRNFGPRGSDEWQAMWRAGRWDERALRAYFDRWRDRFDLFHAERPFYQVASLKGKIDGKGDGYELPPAGKLGLAYATGNSPTLFDHSLDADPVPLSPAAAACCVVACQAFQLGGLVSRLPGEPPSAPAAPLAKGAAIFVTGDSLFETLMYNLIAYDPVSGLPFPVRDLSDRPAWEQDAAVTRTVRPPLGYVDYLTWQSMRIKLWPEVAETGAVVVRHVIVAAGAVLARGRPPEPQFAYRKNLKKNLQPTDEPWLPVRFRADRALWRDSTALLASAPDWDTKRVQPLAACTWVGKLSNAGVLSHGTRLRLVAYGLCSDRAKVDFWREESIPVPASYLVDRDLLEVLDDALSRAEKAGAALGRYLASPETTTGKKVQNKGPAFLPHSVAATGRARYWAALEPAFAELLEDVPAGPDDARRGWAMALRMAALRAFDAAVQPIDRGARYLKHAIACRLDLERELNALTRPHEEAGNG